MPGVYPMADGGVSLNGGDRRRNDKSFFVYAKQRIRRYYALIPSLYRIR